MDDALSYLQMQADAMRRQRKQGRGVTAPALPEIDPPLVPGDELRAKILRAADGRPWVWFPVEPMGAVRQTQADRWKGRPVVARYHAWRDRIRPLLAQVEIPQSGAWWLFLFAIPKSWTKQRRLLSPWMGHQQKPDTDNCVKAILDAAYDDDAHIWDVRGTKLLWHHPGIVLIQPGDR